MYVLTINNSIGGAAAILDEKTMGEIAERLNGDYVVIPSSTNEVIVVPISNALTTGQLDEMVHEVNETQVSVEERLSEHVYMYDAKEHQLLTAEHYEERRAAKEHDIVAEITSVKDKLMDKSAEVVKKEAAREHPIKAKDVMVLA